MKVFIISKVSLLYGILPKTLKSVLLNVFRVILAVKVVKNVIFGGFGGQNGGQRPPIGPVSNFTIRRGYKGAMFKISAS